MYYAAVTVYIEIVIFNNFAIDLFLGITASLARRRKIHKWRQIFAAAVGTVCAVAYAVLPAVAQIIIRIALAPVLVALFDKYSGVKDYLTSLGIFVALTFALGGAVSGISNLTGIKLEGYVTLGLVFSAAVAIELAVRFFVLKRGKCARVIKPVSVGYKGRTERLNALFDSGNALTDGLSAKPVVLLSKSAESKLSGLDFINPCNYEGFINAKTVGGEKSLPLVRLDGIGIDGKTFDAYAALTKSDFENFDVILHNTMCEGEYEIKKTVANHSAVAGSRAIKR